MYGGELVWTEAPWSGHMSVHELSGAPPGYACPRHSSDAAITTRVSSILPEAKTLYMKTQSFLKKAGVKILYKIHGLKNTCVHVYLTQYF